MNSIPSMNIVYLFFSGKAFVTYAFQGICPFCSSCLFNISRTSDTPNVMGNFSG
jgi:hypothetical protein